MLWHTPTPFAFGSNVYSTQWIHVFQRYSPLVETIDCPFSSSSQKGRSLSSPKGFLDEWKWLPRKLGTRSQQCISPWVFNLFLAWFPKEMRQQWDVYQFPSVLFFSFNTFPHLKLSGSVADFNILQSSEVLKDTEGLQLPCSVSSPGTKDIGKSRW